MLRFIYTGELDPKVLENEEVNIIIYKYTQYSYSIKYVLFTWFEKMRYIIDIYTFLSEGIGPLTPMIPRG